MKPSRCDSLKLAVAHALESVKGQMHLKLLRHRHRALMREIDPLATYLELDLFPGLREEKVGQVRIVPATDGHDLHFSLGELHAPPPPYPAPCLAGHLEYLGVRELVLDTDLESGQITEAFLLLMRAREALDGAVPAESEYSGWNPAKIAAAMVGAHGYKKFCAVIHLDRKRCLLSVRYSYCPLFLSRLTEKFASSAKRFADHRVFFRLAPRAAALTLLLFAAPAVFLTWSPALSILVTVIAATLGAAMVWTSFFTIGSIQYDKEHYESLRRQHYDQIQHLARFPETNPNPILELTSGGDIAYVNPSARKMLSETSGFLSDASALLPEDRIALVFQAMNVSGHRFEFEHRAADRLILYTVAALPDEKTVIVSGRDITRLRKVEDELRILNENLEAAVVERTEELTRTQEVTILCLAGLAESRDPETGRHLDRTQHYVRILAEELRSHESFAGNLTEAAIRRAYQSAPLHDIGKVGVPDAVLLKPGRLTPEEFEQIKVHPIVGGDALQLAEKRLGHSSFLSMAKDIAYYHHERWDGKGYPFGISGEAIPWPARLMSVADVYDALTSRRPYKKPWPHEEARDEIRKNRESQFDPDVVDAFLATEEEFRRIARDLAETEEVHSPAR